MTAKEYLQQAYRLNELIASDEREKAALQELLTSLPSQDASKDIVSASKDNSASFTKIVEKIADLDNQINEEIERLVALKTEIRNVINAVPDNDERLCLRLRYIEFLTWEQVAEKMNYERRQVFRLHGNALNHVKVP